MAGQSGSKQARVALRRLPQRQRSPQAAPRSGQPRPLSRVCRHGWPYRALFRPRSAGVRWEQKIELAVHTGNVGSPFRKRCAHTPRMHIHRMRLAYTYTMHARAPGASGMHVHTMHIRDASGMHVHTMDT